VQVDRIGWQSRFRLAAAAFARRIVVNVVVVGIRVCRLWPMLLLLLFGCICTAHKKRVRAQPRLHFAFRSRGRHRFETTAMSAAAAAAVLADVLQFWFAGADDAHNNVVHTRWFVADRSPAQRALDDAIRARFGAALERAKRGEFDESAQDSAQSALAVIVLLDQLARHVHRGDSDQHALAASDERALALAEMCLERAFHLRVSTAEFVFMLMPLRHAARRHDVALLRRVVELIEQRAERDLAHTDVLARFRRTTFRRLYDAELHQWSSAALSVDGVLVEAAADDSILERPYRQCDESQLHTERLYRTVDQFLAAHKPAASRTVCVSLSGGVDSMVLCFLC
jgi:uncharacterized protein (DUF924 family)